ncbi:hypothetical protein [Leptolyngbya sp. FACHB-17]|uniref:hypothetical protein n=1 Tax=unclassified Leptolyngbya TaxID=2650499 RepID=UPI0016805932|nr:hypothetical protein [Leptolyngbya sp. FACHB-17]MBD2079694.1 hypothetical protein [Leptolyngbya sp. FACHB-17]
MSILVQWFLPLSLKHPGCKQGCCPTLPFAERLPLAARIKLSPARARIDAEQVLLLRAAEND